MGNVSNPEQVHKNNGLHFGIRMTRGTLPLHPEAFLSGVGVFRYELNSAGAANVRRLHQHGVSPLTEQIQSAFQIDSIGAEKYRL